MVSKQEPAKQEPVFKFLLNCHGVMQQSIAKGVEEKISGDQRRYFLMEQLKAIKKVQFPSLFALTSP